MHITRNRIQTLIIFIVWIWIKSFTFVLFIFDLDIKKKLSKITKHIVITYYIIRIKVLNS